MALTDEQLSAFVAGEDLYQAPEKGFAVEDVFDWAGTTVTDVGVTMWNSLTPEDWNTETDDLLVSLGFDDAARFYEENRDLVQASSFFAGLLVPFGPASLATRAVGLMRTGKLARVRGNPFAAFDKRLQTNRQQTLDLVANGDKATEAYKKLKRERMLLTGGEAVLDSFAVEAMVAGLMREHAWLKDYSPTEFVFGGFLGAGIVAPIKWISDSSQLTRLGSDIELSQVKDVYHLQSTEYPKWQSSAEILKESRAKLDELKMQQDTVGKDEGFRQKWLDTQVANENQRFLTTLKTMLDRSAARNPSVPPFKKPAEGELFELGARAGTVEEGTFGELVNMLKGDPAENALDGVQQISRFSERSSLADDYIVEEFSTVRRTERSATRAQQADTEVHLDIPSADQTVQLLYGSNIKPAKGVDVAAARGEYETAMRNGEVSEAIDVSRDGSRFVVTVDRLETLQTDAAKAYVRALAALQPTGGMRIVTTQDHKKINSLYERRVARSGPPREVDRIMGAKRPSDELPVRAADPSVVFDPWLQKVVSSVDAAIMLRASDAGHKLAKKVDFGRSYDPLRDDLTTWQADGLILDAVNASRRKAFQEEELALGLGDVPQFSALAVSQRFDNVTVGGPSVMPAVL